jgi:hypothetical protein
MFNRNFKGKPYGFSFFIFYNYPALRSSLLTEHIVVTNTPIVQPTHAAIGIHHQLTMLSHPFLPAHESSLALL